MKQIHPELELEPETKEWLQELQEDTYARVVTEAVAVLKMVKKNTVSSREIQTAVRLVFPGELAKHAVSEGTKAVCKACSGGGTPSISRAGLTLAAKDGVGALRKLLPSPYRLGSGAPIYATAVVEYVTAEILELSGNASRDRDSKTISVLDVANAISSDEELCVMFGAPHTSWAIDPQGQGRFHAVPQPIASIDLDQAPTKIPGPIFARTCTSRLVREIGQDFKCDLRFPKKTLDIIHAAMEAFLANLFQLAKTSATEHGRTTITVRDFRVARALLFPTPSHVAQYHMENNPFYAPLFRAEMEKHGGPDGPSGGF